MAKLKESYCLSCHRMHDLSEFYVSDNPFHANCVLPYCKEECKAIAAFYIKQTSKLSSGLYFACAAIGIPFLQKPFDIVEGRLKSSGTQDAFSLYYKEYLKYRTEDDGLCDFSKTDVDYKDVVSVAKAVAAIRQESEELKLIWGDKTLEQLQYLEYRYEIYTEDKDLTEYQSKLYRTLCLAELDEYEGNDVKGAVDRQAKIAKTLGIDQFNIDKELSLTEKMLENQIAVMENEEPAIFYKDLSMYADFMGIGAYWENHVIRPLRNLLLNSKEYNIIPDDDKKAISEYSANDDGEVIEVEVDTDD